MSALSQLVDSRTLAGLSDHQVGALNQALEAHVFAAVLADPKLKDSLSKALAPAAAAAAEKGH